MTSIAANRLRPVRKLRSRTHGHCYECGEPIVPGEWVGWISKHAWHRRCVDDETWAKLKSPKAVADGE